MERWTAGEVGDWMYSIGMDKYRDIVIQYSISGDILLDIYRDSHKMKQLGIVSRTDRELIREKIKEMRRQTDRNSEKYKKDRVYCGK